MDGIINIYKEQDYTSFDVIAKLRGILHMKKIGHTGTLDPMAEGVLPVALGNATKLCELLTEHDKEYEAIFILGMTYDTLDVTGNKLTEQKVMSTKEDVINAVKSFVPGYMQTPPMYSAKKVDGKKLYELARQGKEIERKAVFVDIYSIDVLWVDLPRVKISVKCGKGTYIRSLISDIGEKLSCGAVMESLVRTKVGDFSVEDALRLGEVEDLRDEGTIEDKIIPLDKAVSCDKDIYIPEQLCKLIDNGNKLDKRDFSLIENVCVDELTDDEMVRVYDYKGQFKALYKYNKSKNELKPFKMFLG